MFLSSQRIFWLPILLVIVLICSASAAAQSFRVVVSTDEFTDYVFTNDSLLVTLPQDILIPYENGRQNYRILEQQLIRIPAGDKRNHPVHAMLHDSDTPLTQILHPGIHRGQMVANLLVHTTRTDRRNSEELLVVQHMRIRVYHSSHFSSFRQQSQQDTPLIFPTPVLRQGDWYKIQISEDGIYTLDRDYLNNLGIPVSTIDPRNIQIWTTDGFELPLANSLSRSELQQIPIIVEGEENGTFNSADRVLFYANSVHRVIHTPNASLTHAHSLHPYSRFNYVYLTVGQEPGLRLEEASTQQNPTSEVTRFMDFVWKEQELHKPESRLKSGTQWLGQQFESSINRTQTIFLDTIPGIITDEAIRYQIQMVVRGTATSRFDFVFNSQQLPFMIVPGITSYTASTGAAANRRNSTNTVQISAPDNILQLDATFSPGDGQARGWVDFIQLNIPRTLTAHRNRLRFFSPENGSGQLATYRLRGFSELPIVLDVSNPVAPVRIAAEQENNEVLMVYTTTPGTHFFASSTFLRPPAGQRIPNQHISDIAGHPDYIIITSEMFLPFAEELADYRRSNSGLSPVIATQTQIFNEFNGGVPDITAIRDYIRYVYEAANSPADLPRYVLFFGNTTFDYKGILTGVPMRNHVFTYQSPESLHRTNTFATDDFFGFLERSKGDRITNERMDIGIGRLPVNTTADARLMLDKIYRFEQPDHRGDWRSIFTFLADDDINPSSSGIEADLHILNADFIAQRIPKDETGIRTEKIYQLDYPIINTASGARVPEATQALIDRINNGSLILNFSGHGNEEFLTSQRLFSSTDIPRLTNEDRLSIFVTATCEFGRYDDTDRFSGAERLLLESRAGVVAALTTTRVVFTDPFPFGVNNFALNVQLTDKMLLRDSQGRPRKLGDIMMDTKNTNAGQGFNSKKFILLGDPAMRLGLPEHKVVVTEINNQAVDELDGLLALRALDRVIISGRVESGTGQFLQNYNGEANVRVFDAARFVNYPAREWVPGSCYLEGCGYEIQNDLLFNGRVSVQNGLFQTEFIIPKDISYSDSTGRIQIYANSGETDAVGSWSQFFVNGRNPDAQDDGTGPEIDLFLNDESFVNGMMVNDTPILHARLVDDSGINTTGAGIGHEIIAILTNEQTNRQQTFILNEFYQSELNDFTQGSIRFPLHNLDKGRYELTLRAWDVFNNPGEQSIYFEVSEAEELVIRNLFNYPNPMHNFTYFAFEHNQAGVPMDITIRIFTLSGQPVSHIRRESYITNSNRVQIEWDGRDRDFDRLANGTYLYHVRISADTIAGRQHYEKIERLVIIR